MAAPYVPVVNGGEFNLNSHDLNGDNQQNTFWVQRGGAWTSTLLEAMADAIITWWATGDGVHSYKAFMTSHQTVDSVSYRDHTTQVGLVGVRTTGLPAAGTTGPPSADPGLTWSVTARTGLAGRSFRGRSFIVGMPDAFIADKERGTIDPAQVPGILAAFNSLITAVNTADATAHLVVCSRFHQPGGPGTPSVPRAAGVTTPIIAYGYSKLFTDFQRRRAPGHGRHH